MSIIITNITDQAVNPLPTGEHKYVLKINNKVICEFTHTREDGLAVCLEKASKAADKQMWLEVSAAFEAFNAACTKQPE